MFTPTTLLASATELLQKSGYRTFTAAPSPTLWASSRGRLFEDPYGIVAVAVFDSWSDLSTEWADAQAALVDTLSSHVSKGDPKSWEGYLVLLTPAFAAEAYPIEVNAIRYNTSRVRKLIGTGEELRTLEDVRRVLLPLLPVSTMTLDTPLPALTLLIEELAKRGVNRSDVTSLVAAFARNEPLMPSLAREHNDEA